MPVIDWLQTISEITSALHFSKISNKDYKNFLKTMKMMNECNNCAPRNNPWTLASDIMKERNCSDISKDYKNFLENDIDFNEQHDYSYRTKQQDIFGHGLDYDYLGIMHPQRRMLHSFVEFANMNDNAFKHPQIYDNQHDHFDEIHAEHTSTINSGRMEPGGTRKLPIRRFLDDFTSVNICAGWPGNNFEYEAESYNQSHKAMKTHNYSRECYDDGIHSMLATDSSLTSTPSNHQKSQETAPRPLINEPSEEIYTKNPTLKLLRSHPKFDPKWVEFQSDFTDSIHYGLPYFNNPNQSSTALDHNQPQSNLIESVKNIVSDYSHSQSQVNNSNNFQLPKSNFTLSLKINSHLEEPNQVNTHEGSNKKKVKSEAPKHLKQKNWIESFVQLNLEEFTTGKNSPYPKYLSVPKPLQLLIENDPDGFMKGLNLPLEVAEHLKASKILKRLKFATKQKIGQLTFEERKLRIIKYRQKQQNRIIKTKANNESRKQAADNRLRVKGKFIAKDNSKDAKSETADKEAIF